MKITKKNILTLLAGTALLTSCGDFGDMNTDPNRPSNPLTSGLLTSAEKSIDGVIGDATSVLYAQQLSQKQYTEGSRYQTIYFNFNGYYAGPLMDLQRIIDLNTNEETKGDVLTSGSNANQLAVARILRAYFFGIMTDRWGSIPYSNALQGEANFAPSYDTQEAIYNDLLNELKNAAAQIQLTETAVEGDFLFNGDMQSWINFANSLRMIYALRISDVAGDLAKTHFVDAYQNGGISQNVMYPYLADANNQNPWYARYLTRVDYAISDTMFDYMNPLNDPRLPVFADPAKGAGEIVPMPYGIANTAAGEITNDEISYLGSGLRGQGADLPILTLAQLHFSAAEAAVRGWISEDAEMHYNAAIKASMMQFGVYSDASFAAYIAQPEVKWSSADAMKKIGYQKWVALFLQGFESWSEWRRLDYPVLTPAKDAMNDSKMIPVRQAYPTTERDINSDNYNAAVSAQGADDLDTKVWWDVK